MSTFFSPSPVSWGFKSLNLRFASCVAPGTKVIILSTFIFKSSITTGSTAPDYVIAGLCQLPAICKSSFGLKFLLEPIPERIAGPGCSPNLSGDWLNEVTSAWLGLLVFDLGDVKFYLDAGTLIIGFDLMFISGKCKSSSSSLVWVPLCSQPFFIKRETTSCKFDKFACLYAFIHLKSSRQSIN